jgi:hypothetical protein
MAEPLRGRQGWLELLWNKFGSVPAAPVAFAACLGATPAWTNTVLEQRGLEACN